MTISLQCNNNKTNNNGNNMSLANVLKSISDDKSLSIFRTIADVNSNGEIGINYRFFKGKFFGSMALFYTKHASCLSKTSIFFHQN